MYVVLLWPPLLTILSSAPSFLILEHLRYELNFLFQLRKLPQFLYSSGINSNGEYSIDNLEAHSMVDIN
jgi:hypothetical protein